VPYFEFINSNGTYFYLDENGNIAKNCEKIIDNYYYKFDADGKYVRSKLDENGQLGYVQGDYAMNQQQQYWNKKSNPFQNNQTVQWINATYAILTKNDGNHIRAFGGFLITDDLPDPEYAKNMVKTKLREGLSSAWGVTDRTSAEAVVERLIQSGQATGSAWDYSRAMSNLGFYYHADYYTLEESLDKSLEVGINKELVRCRIENPLNEVLGARSGTTVREHYAAPSTLCFMMRWTAA